MGKNKYDLGGVLKTYWGYDSFRPFQKDIVQSILNKKDTLAILPTGGGKSLCYQLPTLACAGFCIVISPLIALMKDQVEDLIKKGIPAIFIEFNMSSATIERILHDCTKNNYQFLYTSPERIQTHLFKKYSQALNPEVVAIDEAHCISEWGHDFRPQYLKLKTCKEVFPDATIVALTASATKQTQIHIIKSLSLNEPKVIVGDFKRPNLSYSIFEEDIKMNKLMQVIQNVEGSGIIYCKTRRQTIELHKRLVANNISCDFYHAGLSMQVRNRKQEDWYNGNKEVIISTTAFGMGINKENVRKIVHYYIPESIELYYQQAGRAGRDGKKAFAVLLYSQKDLDEVPKRIKRSFLSRKQLKEIYRKLHALFQPMSEEYPQHRLQEISKAMKLDITTLHNALKQLDMMGLIQYEENTYKKSEIMFLVDRTSIKEFLHMYPKYKLMCETIFRSYSGVFDIETTFDEEILSQRLHMTTGECVNILHELQKHNIIKYTRQKGDTYIQMYNKSDNIFSEKWTKIEMLLKHKLDKWDKMKKYILNNSRCRSSEIEKYFLENKDNFNCNVCDVCIEKRKKNNSKK